ncbi:MAG: ABC transporter ATP-binding protein [Halobacteriota archaeon]|nr:ABC transporter ATP-binding protein [Halobacteriota archaeon]
MKSDTIIKTENLKKTYQLGDIEVPALKGVDISIKRGEFVALMGPSGSGKSTLLHQIGILDTPTSGKVFLDGHDTSKLDQNSRADLRLSKCGFVFQFFSLFMELSALENVMIPLMLSGLPREKCKKQSTKLLDLVGLSSRLEHLPSELSGGEQQRVAIARALINEPSILLADEPTANLDSKTSDNIVDLFRHLNEDLGVTIFLVTHEEELGNQADRIIWIRDGVEDGCHVTK